MVCTNCRFSLSVNRFLDLPRHVVFSFYVLLHILNSPSMEIAFNGSKENVLNWSILRENYLYSGKYKKKVQRSKAGNMKESDLKINNQKELFLCSRSGSELFCRIWIVFKRFTKIIKKYFNVKT